MSRLSGTLAELIDSGWNLKSSDHHAAWSRRTVSFLSGAVGADAAASFTNAGATGPQWSEGRDGQIGVLEALLVRDEQAGQQAQKEGEVAAAARAASLPKPSKRVFVVHGHDEEAKQTTARFLEHIGLEPVILHEQPNSGRTIIEKFEDHADVGFAVVLLTPDDVAHPAGASDKLSRRARQNVILELGYFIGRLTRRRVCALYKPGVEIPSDYQGVGYVEFDPTGGWRTKLAQELVEEGFAIKLEALLK